MEGGGGDIIEMLVSVSEPRNDDCKSLKVRYCFILQDRVSTARDRIPVLSGPS